jgi:hypothetical protein
MVHDIALDDEVVVDEVGRVGVVGDDAADLGRCQDHDIGPFHRQEGSHRGLVLEIELRLSAGDEFDRLARPLPGLEPPQDRRAHHAAVAGDENPVGSVHMTIVPRRGAALVNLAPQESRASTHWGRRWTVVVCT